MSRLLFLTHRIPFPPDKGDKIRSFNLLRHLSARHEVLLGGFVDNQNDWKFVANLEEFCSEIQMRPINPWRARFKSGLALLRRRSLSVGYYSDTPLARWVSEHVTSGEIDTVICFSSVMAQFLPETVPCNVVVIADFVDLDSDKWRQYSRECRWPKSAIYAYEAKALSKWELEVLDNADAVTLVSAEECRLLSSRSSHSAKKVQAVRNGVDDTLFRPSIDFDSPYPTEAPVAVFTGAMDYFANVQGVKWFADFVWPAVKRNLPDAQFWIVGSNPAKEVLALESETGIHVTGYVADVRPFLKHASVAVAPLQLARGVQNKVLEALAMGLPVIATPQALQGLEGDLPDSVTAVYDAEQYAERLLQALSGTTRCVAAENLAYIRTYYDWSRNLSEIDNILAEASRQKKAIPDTEITRQLDKLA